MKKYFIKAGVSTEIKTRNSDIINPITISKEQYDYFQSALKYAKQYGFKIKLFDKNGKCFALQG